MKSFTDPIAALDKASLLARHWNRTYYVVNRNGELHVQPRFKEGDQVVETVRPPAPTTITV